MPLGFAFVRPQALNQAPGQDDFRAFELVGDFLDALLKDPQGAQAVAQGFAAAGRDLLPHFLLSRQEPLRKAEGRIRQIFKPFADILHAFLSAMGRGIPDTFPAALRGLQGLVSLLKADSATALLRDLIHLAQTDLEITPEAVEALFRSFIDQVVRDLQSRVNGGDLSEEALNRYEWGVNLKSLELLILEELDWPSLDLEVLVDALKDLYQRTGFEDLLGKISRVLDAAADVAEPLGKILDTVLSPAASNGGSVGAAAAGDMPPVGSDDPISHYASWVLQKNVRFKVDEHTETITPITWITYKHVSPNAMEQLALHTRWISDFAGALLHIISIEKGDMASNILQMFWDGGDLIATVTGNRIPNWAQWTFTPIISFLGGLERTRCGHDDAMYPLTLMLGDGGETMLYRRWRWLFREGLLSFVTLYNYDPDARTRWQAAGSPTHVAYMRGNDQESWPVAFNNDQFQGTCYVLGEVGKILLPAILSKTDRMKYGFIGGGPTGHMVGCALGGWAISITLHYMSLFLCKLAAGEYPDDSVAMVALPLRERYIEKPDDAGGALAVRTVHGILVGGLIEWCMQVIYLYLFTNGNTSDGKFSAQDKQDLDFNGYPDNPAGSPYKLPWLAGNEQECVQNPMGIWSHYPDDGQAYAYDFNHDAGTEVLCSRAGIVTHIDQTFLNNNTSDWNNIEVMALKVHPSGTANTFPGVEPPAGCTYKDGTAIAAGTKFPPYWDVRGKTWPMMPPVPATGNKSGVPLHPSGALLPGTPPAAGGLPANSRFTFVDPDYDRGFAGITYPADAKFSDGTTPIPAGVCFAPDAPRPPAKWCAMYKAGTVFVPARRVFTAAPFELPTGTPPALATPPVAGFTPAAGATYLDDSPIPAGVILPPDCGTAQAWLPKPHPATPLYLPGTLFKTINDSDYFNAGTGYVASETPFPDIPPADADHKNADLIHQWMTPMVATFCRYGHALAGFGSLPNFTYVPEVQANPSATPPVPHSAARVRPLVPPEARTPIAGQPREDLPDLYGTSDNGKILGRFVEQGRVIMLSGDTGISAYNHLHTHVSPFAADVWFDKDRADKDGNGFGMLFTIPFAYADVKHNLDHGFREASCRDGIPRAMTWYVSENQRTGP